ncbi:hypothetical protein CLV30_10464 [Haloactinopolyspora alba]|uniref:Uncharacterized protein n=1 Tax=Haloactinopolyspora alba TaxID=648780 RepID=A0A2P8E6V0_9ACTN|nr:hypothetical protein CLV30_10464 [Haloactinopolyspora alba]
MPHGDLHGVTLEGVTRTVYGPPTAVAVRGVGVGAVGVGVLTIALSLLLAADLPTWLTVAAVVLIAVAGLLCAVVLVVGVLRVFGRGTRLVLDDEGFTNTTGYRLGARRGAWRDVRRVQTDGSIVSIDLAGGRQSLVRTSALGVEARPLARELRKRLNDDRGYRPLTPPKEPA